MPSPEELDRQVTLRTAVARFDDLATRHVLGGTEAGALDKRELLELLSLGEVIACKAAYGRQLAVRSARAAGASWSEIGRALGATKQAAWEAHTRWIDQQARQHGQPGQLGFDEADAARARAGAGSPD